MVLLGEKYVVVESTQLKKEEGFPLHLKSSKTGWKLKLQLTGKKTILCGFAIPSAHPNIKTRFLELKKASN